MSGAGIWSLRLRVTVNALSRAAHIYVRNDSPRVWAQGGHHLLRRLAGQRIPHTMSFAVTYRCQCRCVHCCAAAAEFLASQEMSTEEAQGVLSQARGMGVAHVIIAGGEPLLREDLPELVAHAHQLGLLTRVSTNGWLLTRERVRELKRSGLDVCGVSLDYADAAKHDEQRGLPGTFQKAVQGIRYLREEGVFSKILFCASPDSVAEGGLERVIRLGRRLGATTVYVVPAVMAGRWAGSPDQLLTPQDLAHVQSLQDFTFVHCEIHTPKTVCCLAHRGVVCVRAGGQVTGCPYVPFVLGNVFEEPLAEIWRRHTATPPVRTPGQCPLNLQHAREALRRDADLVRSAGRR